ncbi:BZ3500_MvSof-1268-A1-R1_Chr8-2g10065 [Microbotryum saponariae]|uniref:BZ3500_MvSof-1268-A1-R1_Chr8-2g10065 protein n=1 Tax=Microbotryum saponariae TaxID=289078 RepID=A0A2X0L538_9BASI|nr:BZ3500_MvSof-1268-A1-R1_Chr8-2g10065 [Microbotryum saponariae]SDA01714.1 BZ3501_MvSof-1269-A2-R1_Chr8-2g09815 [Microbotryum saponariae]
MGLRAAEGSCIYLAGPRKAQPEAARGGQQIWTFLAQNGSRLTSFLDIFLPPVEL